MLERVWTRNKENYALDVPFVNFIYVTLFSACCELLGTGGAYLLMWEANKYARKIMPGSGK